MIRHLVMFLMLIALAFPAAGARAELLNEFEPNPVGGDPADQQFELKGVAGADFSGWVLSLEGDAGAASPGRVDRATQVSGKFDSNGLLVVSIPDLENPTFTVVLTSSFSGDLNTDIDTDDDGFVDDISKFGTIYDALGVPDIAAGDFVYGAQLGGVDFTFTGTEPKLVFRDGVSDAWYALNDPDNGEVFDIDANTVDVTLFNIDPLSPTFGAVNPTTVPEPSSIALLGMASVAGLGLLRRRRK